jgi:hypothetical protein
MASHAKSASLEFTGLRSDLSQNRCADCGTVRHDATEDNSPGATCGCQQGYAVEYITELRCLLCGRTVGTVTTRHRNERVLVSQGVRCEQCGGRPTIGETLTYRRYPPLPRLKLRPGRRPKQPIEALP